jgi:TPR repeat protein
MLTRQLMMGVVSATLLWSAADRAVASDGQAQYDAGLEASAQMDYAQALTHFKQAAALGNRDAQRTGGMMLMYGAALYGNDVPTQQAEAVALLKAAADAGCEMSYFLLTRLRSSQGCV